MGIQELCKTIEQRIIHFRYSKVHFVRHISESIQWMGCGDNFTSDISERLHINNVKEAYPSPNRVNYMRQMLKHMDWCYSFDYMQETLSYLVLQHLYDIDVWKFFNLLSAADKWQNTRRAYLLRLQHHHQEEPFFHPISQQLHHLRETHVRVVCRCIKLTSLRGASVDFRIPNF